MANDAKQKRDETRRRKHRSPLAFGLSADDSHRKKNELMLLFYL